MLQQRYFLIDQSFSPKKLHTNKALRLCAFARNYPVRYTPITACNTSNDRIVPKSTWCNT